MGYYTDYELYILDIETLEEKSLQDIADYVLDFKVSTYFFTVDALMRGAVCQYKWYESDEDMLALSKKFPGLVFKLRGIGENTGDM